MVDHFWHSVISKYWHIYPRILFSVCCHRVNGVRWIENKHLSVFREQAATWQQLLFIYRTLYSHTYYVWKSDRYRAILSTARNVKETYPRWIECIIKLFTIHNKYTRLETIAVMQCSASHAHMIATAMSNGFRPLRTNRFVPNTFHGENQFILFSFENCFCWLMRRCWEWLSLQTRWKTVINIRICFAFRSV